MRSKWGMKQAEESAANMQAAVQVLDGTLLPVVEIFGPTIQGEGRYTGTPCYFLRLGGCDYRCTWCDSMHAVDPKYKADWAMMAPIDILGVLDRLPGTFNHLVISGGNPAIYDLSPLLHTLQTQSTVKWFVSLETQGTITQTWFRHLNHITVSPKPPSSGMRQSKVVIDRFAHYLSTWRMEGTTVDIKVVVFDGVDIDWAQEMLTTIRYPAGTRLFLSIGTHPWDTRDDVMDRYNRVVARVLDTWHGQPAIAILPQMHVLLWGHKKGV